MPLTSQAQNSRAQNSQSPTSLSRSPVTTRALGALVALALGLALMQAAPAHAGGSRAADAAKERGATAAATASIDPRVRRRFGERVVAISRSKAGSPYRYGASGPRAFDCSGFTSWVYRKAGRRIPRTSRQQAHAARRIRARDRRRGDLVFFQHGGRVYHVGIYAGHGRIWHAPRPGSRVRREHIWTRAHFYGRFR